ncbi:unnamed protein product [Prunus armeniaca]|uniref:Protein kinase domain-containing protein n=1 Tax=Prunus armeniaca TaxID=36596 RepID=A0A6J5XBY9_PRUAR|nr:unnamed protein product [Prunus armeniaca]
MASQVMGGTRATHVFSMLVLISFFVIAAQGAIEEYAPMKILMDEWDIRPPGWVGSDPCVGGWEGIECTNSRITSIALADMALTGQLPSDIELLSELEILNLSFNKGLKGPLPASIGKLTKLVYLNLVGCSFVGPIPDTIGSLKQLSYLSLKNNSFNGLIPPSIGNLTKLFFLDLSDNKLVGSFPVPGLDQLEKARHFHFQNNQLSGKIPPELFSSRMNLIHVIFDRNNLTGSIPSTLGLVQSLQAVRLDRNSLNGSVPSLKNLSNIAELHLSNNQLTGPVPNLTNLNNLSYVDMSNNTFDVSDVPSWFSTLQNLTTLMMENTRLQGEVPQALFSNYNLETLVLRNNKINGLLDLETISSNHLQRIDMEKNFITDLKPSAGGSNYTLITLEAALLGTFQSNNLPVESVALGYPTWGSSYHLELFIQVFPSGQDRFNQTEASAIASVISNQTLSPRPPSFGPYSVVFPYGNSGGGGSKKGLIIGAAVGGSVLLLLLALVGVYALQQKRRADEQWSRSIPLSGISNSSASAPRLKGATLFSFEELQKYTNGFSEANDVGAGGYGKVYRGILPTGQMVAIKRAKRDSMQGGPEFTAEVELLSRVHHKNLVSLVGFCLEQGEQILVYEYVPNGDLLDSLSGKSGIRLDWLRRLKIILGAARGLAYLHEHANPPIIHRDIKSNNILLDKD